MSNSKEKKFEYFMTQFLEGDLKAQEIEEFNLFLEVHPEFREKAYLAYQTHRGIGIAHQPFEDSEDAFIKETLAQLSSSDDTFIKSVEQKIGVQPQRSSSLGNVLKYAAVAIFTVGVTLLVQNVLNLNQVETQVVQIAPVFHVATLIDDQEAKWGKKTEMFSGKRLKPGMLHLESGKARIRFDSGAVAILEGPAKLLIESEMRAILREGHATVRAPEEAFGFALGTPESELVDLGTEFAVKVNTSGKTEVHVLDGMVQGSSNSRPNQAKFLVEGEAMAFTQNDSEKIAIDAKPFDDLLLGITQNKSNIVQSKLHVYDGFEYEANMRTLKANKGFGWESGWVRGYFGPHKHPLNFFPNQNLSVSDKLEAGLPGTAHLMGNAILSNFKRKLEHKINLNETKVHYFSFYVKYDKLSDKEDWVRVIWTKQKVKSRLGCGLLAGRPFVFCDGNSNKFISKVIPPKTPCLFVGKIVCSLDGPDEVFASVFVPGDEIDPTDMGRWQLKTKGSFLDYTFDELHIGYGPKSSYMFDEFRVGNTWQSVVPFEEGRLN